VGKAKKKKGNKKKGHKKANKKGDHNAHAHDGEHKKGEIIHDAASLIAELSILVISSAYLLWFLLVGMGYCVRAYKDKGAAAKYQSKMTINASGGFDDPIAVLANKLPQGKTLNIPEKTPETV